MQRQSQHDPRWANTTFGVAGSTLTLNTHGCTVTAIANLTDNLNPLQVAQRADYVPQANLIWASVSKIAGIDFLWRQWDGNYGVIQHRTAQGEGTLIEINMGAGKHWLSVIRLDNEFAICIDPSNPLIDTRIHMSRITGSAFFKVTPKVTQPSLSVNDGLIRTIQGNGGSAKSKQMLVDAVFQGNGDYIFAHMGGLIQEIVREELAKKGCK